LRINPVEKQAPRYEIKPDPHLKQKSSPQERSLQEEGKKNSRQAEASLPPLGE
jgi:hypothetical protein